MGLVPPLGRIARVYLEVLIVMPMAALVPLVILTMGVNIRASATIVFIFSMPFVASNAYGGMRDVDPVLVEMARAFNAHWLQILRAIVLPGALPMILAGARYGLARAFIGLVVAELLLSPFGVGRLIMDTRSTFEFDKMFATVLSMLLVAVMLLSGAQHLESRVLRWRRRGEEGGLQ
jgi:NitT/TauT family transport system permease protein